MGATILPAIFEVHRPMWGERREPKPTKPVPAVRPLVAWPESAAESPILRQNAPRNGPPHGDDRSLTSPQPPVPARDELARAAERTAMRSDLNPERLAAQAEAHKAAALAARCVAGDVAAWEELARTQHRRIYGICYRFMGSASEAEDLTQDVFIKVFKNIGAFDPQKGGFNTWLTTLTRNMLVDNYRKARMDRVTDSLDESVSGDDENAGATKLDRLPDRGRTQEQHVSGLELRVQIQQALKQVSPELREAVILRDLEDMDYKDIAQVLGIPAGTVKSRISRGRAELAKLLKRIEGQVM